jgi:proton glutamate symport protein
MPVIDFLDGFVEAMFKFTKIVMTFAPIGVGAAITYTIAHTGIGVLVNLAKMLVTLYVGLMIFILGGLLPMALMFKVPIRRFLKTIAEPVAITFATTSSDAALPRAIENLEKLGVSRHASGLILPTGYSFNLDGTTMCLALASVFVAQAAGIHMTFGQQLLMMLTLILSSKGVACVPRASLIVLLGTVATFGLPVEPVVMLLGIDELMEMGRSATNQIGNCLAAVVIAKSEGEFQLTPEELAPVDTARAS